MEGGQVDFGRAIVAIAAVFASFLVALYVYTARKLKYWERLGVPGPRLEPFGLLKLVTSRPNFFELYLREYQTHGRLFGHYVFTRPVMVIGEPELIKKILVRDFDKFRNHTPNFAPNFYLDKLAIYKIDDEWRKNRALLSPAFKSGKIKSVFELFSVCADDFVAHLEANRQDIDAKKASGQFSLDVIGRCCFATNADVYAKEESPFVKYHAFMIDSKKPKFYEVIFPKLHTLFRLATQEPEAFTFFRKLIEFHVKQRKENKETRQDFLQILLDAEVSSPEPNYSSHRRKIVEEEIPEQMLNFLFNGHTSTVTLLTFALFHLANDPDCQEKLYQELSEVERLNNETISGLKYMEAFIFEVLRKYPFAASSRICTENYQLDDMNITVPKGMHVHIPVHALHMDPEFFPEPEKFLPDRFMPENKDSLVPFTYLPFGHGPRQCLGTKFVLLQTKVVLAKVVSRLLFKPSDQSDPSLLAPPAFRFSYIPNKLCVKAEKRS